MYYSWNEAERTAGNDVPPYCQTGTWVTQRCVRVKCACNSENIALLILFVDIFFPFEDLVTAIL